MEGRVPVGPSYKDGSLIFVLISASEVLTHRKKLQSQISVSPFQDSGFPLTFWRKSKRSRHNACSIPEIRRTKQIQASMRLSTLQLTTGSVPPFSTQCCQRAIDRLAGTPSKVKRFCLCIFHLWQKSPRNLMSQPGRHSTQNLPE